MSNEIDCVPKEYDWVSGLLSHNCCLVKCDHKFGLVTKKGDVIIPVEYSFIDLHPECIILTKAGKYGLTDWEGNEIMPICCNEIHILSNNSAIISKDSRFSLFFFDKNKEPIEYDSISFLFDNLCKVERNGKYGIIDDAGNTVLPLAFDFLGYYDYIQKTMPAIKDKKYGIIDINGREIIPIIYDPIEAQDIKIYGEENEIEIKMSVSKHVGIHTASGTAMIMRLHGKWGVINSKGKEIIPFVYDKMDYFDKKLIVKASNKTGVVSIGGKQIIPLVYNEIEPCILEEDSFFIVKQNNKYGFISKGGKNLTPLIYDQISKNECEFGYLVVCKDGKWGVVGKKGQEIIECIYDEVHYIDGNKVDVVLNGQNKILEINGIRKNI